MHDASRSPGDYSALGLGSNYANLRLFFINVKAKVFQFAGSDWDGMGVIRCSADPAAINNVVIPVQDMGQNRYSLTKG